jgi:microcin C transport system substrate-binding protein
MDAATDEPDSYYGTLAELVSYPEDFSYVIYRLRPAARWHDGTPVTPEDVIFSFDVFKKNSPRYSFYYQHIVKAERIGDHDVKFTFDSPGNRELPLITGQLNVLPKHWWEGTDAQGRKRDVTATTLEPPLGSGPYRVKDFVAGRSLVLERVKDHWGKDLPSSVGQHNFDELRYEFFRDDVVGRQAFRADQFDWYAERSAKEWSVAYDFAAVHDKRVIKELFPVRSSGRMQGWAFNLRRPLFKDVRLRRAFNLAFDFEEMNRTLSTGEYHRDSSYFDGIPDFMATGLPEGLELKMLEPLRDQVPPEVFTTEYKDPVGGSPDNVRNNLREATRLLKEAGFEVRDRKLVDPAGKQVSIEILCSDEGNERISLFYKPSLERLGVTVSIRRVDDVQFQNRTRDFDFDMTTVVWGQSLSPGNEQRDWFGSQAADKPGSRNVGGIKNPAVDALIERIIFAKDRTEQIAACKAMDRVLLWNVYCVPHFNYGFQRYARWDRFSHPEPLPKYGVSAFPDVWWYDADKAARIGKRS